MSWFFQPLPAAAAAGGPTTVALDKLALVATPLDLTIGRGARTLQQDKLSLTATSQDITIVRNRTIQLDKLTLTATPLDLTIGRGARAIELDKLSLNASAKDVQINLRIFLDRLATKLYAGNANGSIGLWGMEEAAGNARLDYSRSANHLVEDNGSISRGTGRRGSFAVGPFSTSFLIRNDTDLSPTFPGKNGTSSANFSIGFWIKTDSAGPPATMQVLWKGSGKIESWFDASGDPMLVIGYVGGKLLSAQVATPDQWHHVAFTMNAGAVRLYVDGAIADTDTGASSSLASTTPFVVGGFDTGTHDFDWEGLIDEVFVFDRTLTDTEIADIYYGTHHYPKLVLGARAIILDKLSLTATAQDLTIGRGARAIQLDKLALTATALDLTIVHNRTIELDKLSLTATAQDLTIGRGARAIQLDKLALTATAQDLTIGRGARAIQLDKLALTATALDITIDAGTPGSVTIQLDKLALTATAQDITIGRGARAIQLDKLALTATALDLTIVHNRTIQLDKLALTATALDLTIVHNRTLQLDKLSLTATAQDITIGRGARAIQLDKLALTATALDITIQVQGGPVTVLLDRLFLNATAKGLGRLTLQLDRLPLTASAKDVQVNLRIPLDRLALTATALDLTIVEGARALELDRLTLAATPLDLTIGRGGYVQILDKLSLAATALDLTILGGARSLQLDRLELNAVVLPLANASVVLACLSLDLTVLSVWPIRPTRPEGRTMVVAREDRTIVVPPAPLPALPEGRTIVVAPEDRTIVVPPAPLPVPLEENRTVDIHE